MLEAAWVAHVVLLARLLDQLLGIDHHAYAPATDGPVKGDRASLVRAERVDGLGLVHDLPVDAQEDSDISCNGCPAIDDLRRVDGRAVDLAGLGID
jgi:hypothetical protein